MANSRQTNGIVDLHVHTNKSDGTLSPKEVVQKAKAENIKYLSITDHDTIDGVETAQIEANKLQINFITGIEISSKYKGGTLHILGYGIDIKNPDLQQKLKFSQTARKQRNDKIIKKLISLEIPISKSSLLKATKSTSSLGRPHIAQQLKDLGIVKTIDEAFIKFLGDKGKAFVTKEIFTPDETIAIIHQAGGKAVLAHPKTLNLSKTDFDKYLKELMEKGLDGIEVYSSAHSSAQVDFFLKKVKHYGLFPTAGSDFHGSIKPETLIGRCYNNLSIGINDLFKLPFNFQQTN
jgi:3',5'-nucleoside bisphosphate phosphatase